MERENSSGRGSKCTVRLNMIKKKKIILKVKTRWHKQQVFVAAQEKVFVTLCPRFFTAIQHIIICHIIIL